MKKNNWKRIKNEEGGLVYRWFENREIIASVVESNRFIDAKEVRISGKANGEWIDPIIVPISNSIAIKRSDKEYIKLIETSLKRNNIILKPKHKANLERDRKIKAKTIRKKTQPTWRGDLKGSRI